MRVAGRLAQNLNPCGAKGVVCHTLAFAVAAMALIVSLEDAHATPKADKKSELSARHATCIGQKVSKLRYAPYSPKQVLDLFLPHQRTETSNMPVVVWIHGGGWAGGSRFSVKRWALRQTCRGYAVASVSYRLSWEAPFRAPLVDVKNAIRFLKKEAWRYDLDVHRIAVWGASAGGHLAALVGTTGHYGDPDITELHQFSSRVQAVVAWWAPSDFLRIDQQWPAACLDKGQPPRDVYPAESPESRLIGCPLRACPDAAKAASPITHAQENLPPFLLMAGKRDCTVPWKQSKVFAAALRSHKVTVETVFLKNAAHGDHRWNGSNALNPVDNFLDKHLQKEK